ncbi:MAG: nucleotidyltransferase domain-containing protein [Desulfobacterales bacterium]|nr:nucleotidyltransferase domain-containing protein [Desulfobacterales bacterium]
MTSKTKNAANETDNSLVEAVERCLNHYISNSDNAQNCILAVYLFGSALQPEKFKPNSDIDLAFFLEHSLYKQDPVINSAPAYMAAADLGTLMGRQTDVIILNSASIETAYQAVSTGILLYEGDPESRLEYEAALRGLYFDFRPFLEELRAKTMSCTAQ